MKKSEFEYVVQFIVNQLTMFLIEDNGCSIIEALDIIYNSRTYRLLRDKGTGLYLRSAAYVYEYLKKETNTIFSDDL